MFASLVPVLPLAFVWGTALGILTALALTFALLGLAVILIAPGKPKTPSGTKATLRAYPLKRIRDAAAARAKRQRKSQSAT